MNPQHASSRETERREPSTTLRAVEAPALLVLERLGKTYRDPMTLRPFTAVDGLSLQLERGEIFGLLGPNGAGKTTTIKMILGLARPTVGAVRLEGKDPRDPAARRGLGYLPENPCFYDHLTAWEYLELAGSLFGLDAATMRARAGDLLQRLDLESHAKKRLRKFSKGMTQRLGLVQALLNRPSLIVLDEPMSGLDPIGRSEVKQLLREERARGATVLLSSHVLAETESLCDRVGILKTGRLVEVGSVPGLLATGVREWEITVESLSERLAGSLRERGHEVLRVASRWVVTVADGADLQEALRSLLAEAVFVHAVEPRRRTLEEHFVAALRDPSR
ncbi:MAG TPA: ABC transporter ATP-binding protein [Candidatus Eisenbacteria bacterium]|jgi:ABC-2 type transport system ATP-binding protein|nr:ABC transporter ATP-binding protein [Candidatus Eisenbacteria bacterium]